MKDIEYILINKNYTIRESMRKIDSAGLRTVFVVDKNNTLIGSISDGDIRRGLLKDLNMDDSIKNVINKKPVFIDSSASKIDKIKIIEKNGLACLPVLDIDGKVIEVETLISLNKSKSRKNPVFIMAGGFGTRLRPLTDECPKPMLTVGGKPILEIIISRLKSQGFNDFYLSTHYLPEVIKNHFKDGKDFGIKITYLHEEKPLGTGGALALLPKDLSNFPILMLNGDVLTDLDFAKLLDFHNKNRFDVTMCVKEVGHQISYGVVDSSDGEVIGMREKPTIQHDINTGIYIVCESCVKSLTKNTRIDMPSYLELKIHDGYKVGSMRHSGYWLDIGRIDDYHKAQRDIKDLGF